MISNYSKISLYQHHLTKSQQMGLFPKDKQIIDKMAEFIDSKEKVHLIPIEVTQKSLIQSMMELEGYIRKI